MNFCMGQNIHEILFEQKTIWTLTRHLKEKYCNRIDLYIVSKYINKEKIFKYLKELRTALSKRNSNKSEKTSYAIRIKVMT